MIRSGVEAAEVPDEPFRAARASRGSAIISPWHTFVKIHSKWMREQLKETEQYKSYPTLPKRTLGGLRFVWNKLRPIDKIVYAKIAKEEWRLKHQQKKDREADIEFASAVQSEASL